MPFTNYPNLQYFLTVLLFGVIIRGILCFFKAHAIKQGEADEKDVYKFSGNFCIAWRKSFFGFCNHRNTDDYWLPTMLGFLELYWYPVFIVMGKPEIIGFWLGIKTASGWGVWQRSRTSYNRFLIGNALAITFSLYLLTHISFTNLWQGRIITIIEAVTQSNK